MRVVSPVVGFILAASLCFAGNGFVRRAAHPIKGEYIVILRPDIPAGEVQGRAAALASGHSGRLRRVMKDAAKGFSVNLTPAQAERLAAHPDVLLVEENGYVELSGYRPAPDERWNLDRVDQDYAVTTGDDLFRYCNLGIGVYIYIPDTGVLSTHQEFSIAGGGSRVVDGVCYADDCNYPPGADVGKLPCGGFTTEINGSHGTAVASVAAGNDSGVASGAFIVPVRVLNCDAEGTIETLNWGLDWIKTPSNPHRGSTIDGQWVQYPAVISMSTFIRTTNYLCDRRMSSETDAGANACTDTVDNDCDGLTDGADPDCGGQCNNYLGPGCEASALEYVLLGLIQDGTTSDQKTWKGIPVVASANNHDTQWNLTTPARMAYSNAQWYPALPAHVISVGGTARGDDRWDCPEVADEVCPLDALNNGAPVYVGSNFGPTVDIWAPAHDLQRLAFTSSNTAYRTAFTSGTSFAAPLAAGVIAVMREQQPTLTPAQLWQQLSQNASHAATVIDSVTGNDRIVHMQGCYP
ncbi:MAG TPA: S8 family serine peptidase [Thermoanaerobaculia bacterium]